MCLMFAVSHRLALSKAVNHDASRDTLLLSLETNKPMHKWNSNNIKAVVLSSDPLGPSLTAHTWLAKSGVYSRSRSGRRHLLIKWTHPDNLVWVEQGDMDNMEICSAVAYKDRDWESLHSLIMKKNKISIINSSVKSVFDPVHFPTDNLKSFEVILLDHGNWKSFVSDELAGVKSQYQDIANIF